MSRASKRNRDRPLADPKRAPYAREALLRKQLAHQREVLADVVANPVRLAATQARLAECLRLLADEEES